MELVRGVQDHLLSPFSTSQFRGWKFQFKLETDEIIIKKYSNKIRKIKILTIWEPFFKGIIQKIFGFSVFIT